MIISQNGMSRRQIINAIDSSPYNIDVLGETWLESPENIAYTEGENLVLFSPYRYRTYEMHYFIRHGGRKGLDFMFNAFSYIFDKEQAIAVVGFIPTENRRARVFSKWLGGRHISNAYVGNHMVAMYTLIASKWRNSHGVPWTKTFNI